MLLSPELQTQLTFCWQLLSRGAAYKRDPFHTPVIGTLGSTSAQMRTVVLRRTLITQRQLIFYTDIRSDKVQELRNDATLSWLFYHPKKAIQIRAVSQGIIHHKNELAKSYWQQIPWYGRKTYGTTQAPATPLPHASDNLPDLWKQPDVPLSETEYAFKNFAAVVCTVTQLEWLYLDRNGHRRAIFQYEDEAWSGQFIVP